MKKFQGICDILCKPCSSSLAISTTWQEVSHQRSYHVAVEVHLTQSLSIATRLRTEQGFSTQESSVSKEKIAHLADDEIVV